MLSRKSWKGGLRVLGLVVFLVRRQRAASAPDDDAKHNAAVLESYRALDTLASAVFQAGMIAFVGGVTIGLAVVVRLRGIVIVGSFLPLLAGYWAAMAMLDPWDDPPTADRLAEKKADVIKATLLLLGSIALVAVAMMFVTLP